MLLSVHFLYGQQGLVHPQEDQSDPPEEEEYRHEDAIVADILAIARSPVFDSVHSREARRSLADHLVAEAEHWEVPQTEEERMQVATAAFDEHRSAAKPIRVRAQVWSRVSVSHSNWPDNLQRVIADVY